LTDKRIPKEKMVISVFFVILQN